MFEHTVIGGKCSRSRLLVGTYNALDRHATRERIQEVSNVAACVEILQAFFLIFDDVMDGSTMRRGKPCWHRLPGVGLSAINDGLILDSAINHILNDTLRNDPNKDAVSNVFAHVSVFHSPSLYTDIVNHKTSYYTCYAPLRIAMLLADCTMFAEQCKQIAFKMGYLFQAQDDYLDCFGDPLETGKVGSDLREGKCTWVTCRAVEKLKDHPEYTRLFEENFGQASEECEMKVKSLLLKLHVKEDFVRFEADYSRALLNDIECFVLGDLKSVLRYSLSEFLNRKQ
ncbi:unnamed protein product [Toxocara canis]|uniref:Farnesyl pyrophosphate synthase n=1 Tax=Toxocara canis TaxID=6265 RepID=A0A3P7GUY1_TOXCA|nr:unnamed protein product [Toxocara canis]